MELIWFTQKNILRVYPKGTRITSTNFKPLRAWMHGVQMVAFNMQVRVYMGDGWRKDFSQAHFDKYSPPDFYTKLYMVGVPADVRKVRTREIIDDWIPIWNQEFSFPLTVPELALLKIVVREHDAGKDDFAGQTCFPVSELKPGIRVVRLRDKKGKKFKSVKLLMRFTLE
ncbi:putative phosphoinositide phospholipase C [Helianthus anomalus]